MAYINEFVSAEELQRRGVEDLAKRLGIGGLINLSWTIDYARDMYLYCADRGREEFRNRSTWFFHWNNEHIVVDLELLDYGGQRGGSGWSHLRLRGLQIPEHLKNRRAEIISDLKDALVGHKDFGVYSVNTSYSITLDD